MGGCVVVVARVRLFVCCVGRRFLSGDAWWSVKCDSSYVIWLYIGGIVNMDLKAV